jgi:4-alpha-glucanotransferase
VDLEGELRGESGEIRHWQPRADQLSLKEAQTTGGSYLLKLSLPIPLDLAEGYYDLTLRLKTAGREEAGATYLAVSPGQAWVPPQLEQGARLWGLNLPLYALKSRQNWGIGDFSDLRAATAWARNLGAAFVGVNPLHAPQGGTDADPSPYSPASRLFLNFLYADLESIPETKDSPEAQALLASPDFQAELNRLRSAPLVAYPEVYRIKRKFLESLFAAFVAAHGLPDAPRTPRGQEFAQFVAQGGKNLRNYSLFQTIGDHQNNPDWRRWAKNLESPDTPAVTAFAREHPREIAFHQYVQWLAAGQRQEVWQEATRAGLPFTLYQDLALGAAAGGFETWGHPGLFAKGAAMGAPPDAFNLKGQNWGLPPLIPRKLEESRFHLFLETLRANLPPGGIVRMDHVMGLFRLYWIPEGQDPGVGAYVSYPSRDLLGLLTLESQRRRTLVVGEDLGTVAPSIRRDLAQSRIFSYRVFYFERKAGDHFAAPEDYPLQAMACVTTHDLPTLAGYWEGRDLDLRRQLQLYPSPQSADEDAASRTRDRLLLVEALVQQGLLPPDYSPSPDFCPEDLRRAVLAYLGQSRAALMEVRLEELLGLTAQQNLPGTVGQHPNWRQKIPDTLEDMRHNPEAIRLAAALRQARDQDKKKVT